MELKVLNDQGQSAGTVAAETMPIVLTVPLLSRPCSRPKRRVRSGMRVPLKSR